MGTKQLETMTKEDIEKEAKRIYAKYSFWDMEFDLKEKAYADGMLKGWNAALEWAAENAKAKEINMVGDQPVTPHIVVIKESILKGLIK